MFSNKIHVTEPSLGSPGDTTLLEQML